MQVISLEYQASRKSKYLLIPGKRAQYKKVQLFHVKILFAEQNIQFLDFLGRFS